MQSIFQLRTLSLAAAALAIMAAVLVFTWPGSAQSNDPPAKLTGLSNTACRTLGRILYIVLHLGGLGRS